MNDTHSNTQGSSNESAKAKVTKPSHQGSSPDDLIIDYLKLEQPQRRTEIENFVSRVETDQRYGLLLTGLIWTWLLINHEKLVQPFDRIVTLVPPFVTAFFFLRWYSFHTSIIKIAGYMKKVEARFGMIAPYGWETFIDHRQNKTGKTLDSLAVSTFIYWIVLLLSNIVFSVVYWCFGSNPVA